MRPLFLLSTPMGIARASADLKVRPVEPHCLAKRRWQDAKHKPFIEQFCETVGKRNVKPRSKGD